MNTYTDKRQILIKTHSIWEVPKFFFQSLEMFNLLLIEKACFNKPELYGKYNYNPVLILCWQYTCIYDAALLSTTCFLSHKAQSGLFPSSSSFIPLCSTFQLSSHNCLQQDYHSCRDHYQCDHYGCRLYQLAAASPTCHHSDHLSLHYQHYHHYHCHQQMIRIFILFHFVSQMFVFVPFD